MADLYEHYNTGDDSITIAAGVTWLAQTFTVSVAHKITYVKLLLYKAGSPGEVTVSIRATDGEGHPTGLDLGAVGTFEGNDLTEDTDGEWKRIDLGNYNLDTVKYAIVLRALGGEIAVNDVRWKRDESSPTYLTGNLEHSGNSGVGWTTYDTLDCMFEDWGEAIVVGWTGKISGVTNPAKVMGVDVANIAKVKGVVSA